MTTAHALPAADASRADLAALLLRVVTGGLFLFHGLVKLLVFTPAGTAAFFGSLGLPAPVAYLVIAVEVLGGLMLLAGVWTRWVALATIPLLLGTIATVHGAAGFGFSNAGGGWEYPAFWAVVMGVVALLGDGAYALSRR